MKVTAVIPARLGSTRFPGKALYLYRGKPLLFYVWNEVAKVKQIDHLIIATSDSAVAQAARLFGAEVMMTRKSHQTGTDRVVEAVKKIQSDIILNIQGDNLGLKASVLDQSIRMFSTLRRTEFGTLVSQIDSDNDLFNPNVVKVAVSQDQQALWFTRYPIPFLQKPTEKPRVRQYKYWKHIGIYLFRHESLTEFGKWRRSPLEKAESLEQLRILDHGKRVWVFKTTMKTVSVDSPQDINQLDKLYK